MVTVQVEGYDFLKHYVSYKYIDGLDREVVTRVEIKDNTITIINEYTGEKKSQVISNRAIKDIIAGRVSPFSNNLVKKHSYVTRWKEGYFEIRENKGVYRLRKYREDGRLDAGIAIPKMAYEMIRDGIVDPDYYIERIAYE